MAYPKKAVLHGPVLDAMPTGDEVQAARNFLRGVGARSKEIQPRRFAAAAKETGSDFNSLLGVIAHSYQGGQGQEADRQNQLAQITRR